MPKDISNNSNKVGVVIPTYNGGDLWQKVVSAIDIQRKYFDKILVIDSGSSDKTLDIAKKAKFDTITIPSSEFNHGATRNLGVETLNCEIIIFLTQDAIPEENAIKTIIKAFDNPQIAVAYGRQTYHDNANPLAKHARIYNYKKDNYIYSITDKERFGIKTVFTSNSFAAYRISHFREVGMFPNNTIFAEDMFLTAKALLAGHKVAYISEAIVKHSHNYCIKQEFKRSFDIGVFHNKEAWIRENYGEPGGEGVKFVKSEFLYLIKNKELTWIPVAFFNNFFKALGYKLGINFKKLPKNIIRSFSMHNKYWK